MLVAVYLTFSRGALAAVAAGLIVLTVLAPTWGQLRASAIALELGLLGVFAAAAVGPVRTTAGGDVVARDRRARRVRGRCSD